MIECHILRATRTKSHPQLGIFLIEGDPQFLTLECPWLNNEHNISCIPEGEYVCKKVFNRKIGSRQVLIPMTFEVCDVPHRAGILFHIGNEPKDTEGCILIGERIIDPEFIGDSKEGFQNFLEALSGIESFRLIIKRCFQEI